MKSRKFLLLLAGGVLISSFLVCDAFAADPVIAAGKKVTLDYTLTVDKQVLESSKGKKPLEYVAGEGKIIPGLEKALNGMHVKEQKIIVLDPKDAYGEVDPKGFKEFPKTSLPKEVEPKEGMVLQAQAEDGTSFPAVISEVKSDTIVLNFNHPLAGKKLQFDVKILTIK